MDQGDVALLEGGREDEAAAEAVDRPLQELLRLGAFELDGQLARLEVVQFLVHASASSLRLLAGSCPARTPSSSSLVRSQNARNGSCVVVPLREPAVEQPGDGGGELLGGDTAEDRARDRRVGAEAAAQQDVVGLAADSVLVPYRRALEAEVADPVVTAGVRAAVEVQLEPGERVAVARLEVVDQRREPRLRLGDGEVAVRLAGARDRLRAQGMAGERQAELREPSPTRARRRGRARP